MDIEIAFPSGRKTSYRSGIETGQIIRESDLSTNNHEIVAARLNNEIVSLSYPVTVSSAISPILLASKEGMTLYRRTLCFLLIIAAKAVFPERRLVIGHALGEGYYYHFDEFEKISSADISALTDKIGELARARMPIRHDVISYTEALSHFEQANQPHTALFINYQNKTKIPIHRCGQFIDLMHGPLLSNTALLNTFELKNYPPGFLLRFPRKGNANRIAPFKDDPVLFAIYREYKSWGKILNMNCLGRLNQLIVQGNIREFIQVAEALHDKKISYIADKLCSDKNAVRLVLIAGPSSSGKTTFSKKLVIQLRVLGRNPVAISLDDYFLPHAETPLDSDGRLNFETIEAIDVGLLNSQLLRLFSGEEVGIPRFDFKKGKRKQKSHRLRLPPRAVVILEGIHGLDDRLTPQIARQNKFKVYVSALTQLNLDDHNRISTTDNRLIRRMVRDSQFRGHSAIETLKMWPSVRDGENKNIFPFQNSADAAFNSSLDYELSVLKVLAEPLLRTIKPTVREYSEAKRLLSFLEDFLPLSPSFVPGQSILREFVGESEFDY